jgi:hypothetical protein
MRIAAALAIVTVLGACSESSDDAPGGWKKDALADGRLSFEMPGLAEYKQSTEGQGPDAIAEEKATCDYDNRHYSVSVLRGEALLEDLGTTERERFREENMKRFDADGDGRLSEEERKIMWETLRDERPAPPPEESGAE